MQQTVTIKIGSNVLTSNNGTLNIARLENIVQQISELRKSGKNVVLISSGAVAAGKNCVNTSNLKDSVSNRQLWSSVGQVHLINTYSELLAKHGITCAQLLVTKQDFRSRQHYLNLTNCFDTLLSNGILPIVNENDAISVTELMFTDNDELSGMIAAMTDSDALFLLTNVDGIYTGHPEDPDAILIKEVNESTSDLRRHITINKSNFGRGGMVTKYHIAQKVATEGIDVFISNGTVPNIVTQILDGKTEQRTYFKANSKASTVKKWIAHSDGFEKGTLSINEGAENALHSLNATSLLLVGVTKIEGDFLKGDIVKIVNEEGEKVGLGRSMYHSETAKNKLGKKGEKPIIHYDYLYLENNK